MDEQLRANPDDLVALMRAGRLSAECVAMAAYLGDERALATGVEPWEPPDVPAWTWPARNLLKHSPLTRRGRIWLACLLAERAVVHKLSHLAEPQEVLHRVRDWCQGLTPKSAVSDARNKARSSCYGLAASGPEKAALFAATYTTEAIDGGRSAVARVASSALGAFEPNAFAEQAWQAQVIAALLLDCAWPPWDE